MKRMLILALGSLFICAGCLEPRKRLNAPPHGTPEVTSDGQGTFVYMADNALLADMTVSDYHFMPHRALLTTLGKQRIDRLASLIDAYGGKVRFNTDLTDENLARSREDAIVKYLGELGADTSRGLVERGMRGGAGMNADEAILIKQSEATYDPDKAKATSASNASGSLTGE